MSSHIGLPVQVWIHQQLDCKSPRDEPVPCNMSILLYHRCLQQGSIGLVSQSCSADCQAGCWPAGCMGRNENQADLIACLADRFFVVRGFLTPCESFSLTDWFQGKHISQPDLHTYIMSALPCNWKGVLGQQVWQKALPKAESKCTSPNGER